MANSSSKTDKSLSIVIITYNRPYAAVNLAVSIRKIHSDVDIIIVDQLETANIDPNFIHQNNIRFINLPYAHLTKARNAGLEMAIGEVVLFLDDDVEVTKDTIQSHLNIFENEKVVGIAGRVINDGEMISENTNEVTGQTDFLKRKFIQQFWSTKKQEVSFAYGCNMSYLTKVLKQIGGFDEHFSRIFDEIDVGLRITKYGKMIFEPEALVYHHKAVSGGIREDEKKKKDELIFENYGYIVKKHVPFPFSLITLALRTITAMRSGIASVHALYKGYLS